MKEIILVKNGELALKGLNRSSFEDKLVKNIKHRISDLGDFEYTKSQSTIMVEPLDDDIDLDEAADRISRVFGIAAFSRACECEKNFDDITNTACDYLYDELSSVKTFKVEAKRSDKKFPMKSPEISRELGGYILSKFNNLKVDVHNPDTTLTIEILERFTYLYTDIYHGLGGYPVGVQSKGMLMLSGGIDSPVAGWMALKRGVKIDAVYFEAIPHTSLEARYKVIELSRKLCKYCDSIKLHIVPFTNIQEAIYKECNPEYCITIMRRMMYRIMEKLAKKNKGLVIINGESIGQVASQTLTSMSVINSVTNMPVIRPVACLDKLEIIDIAKKIDTYDISILPYEDCCTVFVPKHPVINPSLQECLLNC